jgi:hypothetical protein
LLVKIRARVERLSELPDLSRVTVLQGHIEILNPFGSPARWDGHEVGVPLIDLGPVREMRYRCRLTIQGSFTRLTANALETADTILWVHPMSDGSEVIELPKLRRIRSLYLAPHNGNGLRRLVLPALEEIDSLTIGIPRGPFEFRFPKLARAKSFALHVPFHVTPVELSGSVLDAPLLPKARLRVEAGRETSQVTRAIVAAARFRVGRAARG